MWLLVSEAAVVIFLITAAVIARRCEQRRGKETGAVFYPVATFVVDRLELAAWYVRRGKRLGELSALSVGLGKTQVARNYLIRWIRTVYMVLVAGLLVAVSMGGLPEAERELKKGYLLERSKVDGGSKIVDLKIQADDGQAVMEQEYSLEVKERRLTEEEFVQEVEKQKEYVAKKILGENSSAEHIDHKLELFSQLPDSPLSIEWRISDSSVIHWDGSLGEEVSETGTLVTVTAYFCYEEQEAFVPMEFVVYPEQKEPKDQLLDQLTEALVYADEISSTAAIYTLPKNLGKHTITYEEKTADRSGIVLLLVAAGVFFTGAHLSSAVKKQAAKRELELVLDYPEIIHKFTLLMSAGMTVKRAWERIVEDYRKKRTSKKRFAYEEMQLTLREMQNGRPELEAIGEFGQRIGLRSYQKFCSLLVQNMKKGTKELLVLLEYESAESFRERKETAKRLGEEAGTKMLFPMLLMMAIVFAVIMVPAVMNFSM